MTLHDMDWNARTMDEMNDYLFTQLPVTHATTSYDKLEKPDDNGRYALHYACMKKESTKQIFLQKESV